MKARDVFRTLQWGSRGKPRRHPLTAGILILVLVVQVGCASSGVDKRFALDLLRPSPGEAVQVAVTSGRFTPMLAITLKSLATDLKKQLDAQPQSKVSRLHGFDKPAPL